MKQSITLSNGTAIDLYSKDNRKLFIHRTDREILGRLRACASTNISPNTKGCPAVWVLNEPITKVEITKYWQFYLTAINYAMYPSSVLAELGYKRALANGTGYGKPGVNRANWISMSNLSSPNPLFDKDRSMSWAVLASADNIIYDDGLLFKDYIRGGKKIYQKYIVIKTFDGRMPPPMKEGKRQPERLSDVRIDDYLYNPKDHWEMFFELKIVNTAGRLVPFAGGGLYDWYFNGNTPVCFYPHISNSIVRYPIDFLQEIDNTERPYPYSR